MAELLKKKQGFDRSQRRTFYCLAMVTALVLLLCITMQVAVPAYAQVCKLWQERALEQERLLKLKEFAARHADYSAYEEGRYKELVRLKQGLQRLEDGNLLQRQLQLEAVKRGLALKNMQAILKNSYLQNFFLAKKEISIFLLKSFKTSMPVNRLENTPTET